jgi:hypothetical protein
MRRPSAVQRAHCAQVVGGAQRAAVLHGAPGDGLQFVRLQFTSARLGDGLQAHRGAGGHHLHHRRDHVQRGQARVRGLDVVAESLQRLGEGVDHGGHLGVHGVAVQEVVAQADAQAARGVVQRGHQAGSAGAA